jgi:hypothetical protein
VEEGLGPQRDEPPRARERVHLAIDEAAVVVEGEPVHHDEQIVGKELDLRALSAMLRVLDRQRMELEALLQLVELVVGRVDDIDPDARVCLLEPRGQVLGSDPLLDEHAAAVNAAGHHGARSVAHGVASAGARAISGTAAAPRTSRR